MKLYQVELWVIQKRSATENGIVCRQTDSMETAHVLWRLARNKTRLMVGCQSKARVIFTLSVLRLFLAEFLSLGVGQIFFFKFKSSTD